MDTLSFDSAQDLALLQTKLYIPPVRAGWVSRPRLIERLGLGLRLGRTLTLVSAPAGFGKTTCVSEWVHAQEWPAAWLSLDPEDDDPGRFFAYLVAALKQVNPDLGRELQGLLRAGQILPAEAIRTILINDLVASEGPFLLVLDDVHVIQDRLILQVLEKLVSSLPHPLHMVLITREDPPLPLAWLRANNQLTEIRAGDLRFTSPETDRFLIETMGLSLARADIAVLEEKTEGWIAGLQLAAIALQSPLPAERQAGPSDLVGTLSGSHRYILGYLSEQVLSRQPDEIQQFLLQTSILDKLNGDLCDAVTGRSDSRALLERLVTANLFLIPLDDEGEWYRYHHQFADLLRDLASVHHKERLSTLHRRAGHWYTRAGGERGTFTNEAVHHALAAQDYKMAVNLLERHAMGMIMQGHVKTVNGWVEAIPAEWRLQSPRIHLAFAWMHLLRGAYAQAFPYLEQLQPILADPKDERYLSNQSPSMMSEWLVIQSLLLYAEGKLADARSTVTQALELVPEQDSRVQSLAYYALASICQVMEDDERAIEAYRVSIRHSRAAENFVAEMMSTIGLAGLLLERGQLHLAFEVASQSVDRIERSGMLSPISAVVYGALGAAYYEWGQLDEARHHLLRALELSTLGDYNTGAIFCQLLLARLLYVEGDLEGTAHAVQSAVDRMPAQVPDYVRQEVASHQVRIYLAQERLPAAQMVLQGFGFSYRDRFSFPALSPDQGISYSTGLLYTSSLRALLVQARTGEDRADLASGIDLATCLIARASRAQQLLVVLEALLLCAQMHALLGNHPASRADYISALEQAEPEKFVAIFVEHGRPVADALAQMVERNQLGAVRTEYVERILGAFPSPQSLDAQRAEPPAPDLPAHVAPVVLVEPLTDREREVLGWMAQGLKYKEIAGRLYISLNTVRFHVKAIYGKLNVNNRTQAVERARQLKLL